VPEPSIGCSTRQVWRFGCSIQKAGWFIFPPRWRIGWAGRQKIVWASRVAGTRENDPTKPFLMTVLLG